MWPSLAFRITLAATLPLSAASPRAPDLAEQRTNLAAIRAYALNYTKDLPDFWCHLVSRQFVMGPADKPTDVAGIIEESFTVAGGEESHHPIKIDGRLTADSHHPTFDPLPWRECGTVLMGIFDPHAGREFHWDRWVRRKKVWLWVFAFSVPKSSGYSIVESKRTIVVGYRGLVFADPRTKAVMRIEMEGLDIPSDSEYRSVKLALDYTPTKLADREWILPAHFRQSLAEELALITKEGSYQDYAARPSIIH